MKKKSQFLSSLGTAFQIFKTLADAVLEIGGNDEDMRRVLVDVDLRRDLATRIVGSRNKPNPQTSFLDAALERIEKKEEEIERPKREHDNEIEKFTEEYWAWAQSDEGRKSAKLLEKSRGDIRNALESTLSTHLRSHPNLDTCMQNWDIPTDRERCRKTIEWWYEYRNWGGMSCVEFVRHQVRLVAELPQLPCRNDPLWLIIRVRNAFGNSPGVTLHEQGKMDDCCLEVSFKGKFLAVKLDVESRGFKIFDSPEMKHSKYHVYWKEEAFQIVSKFLTGELED